MNRLCYRREDDPNEMSYHPSGKWGSGLYPIFRSGASGISLTLTLMGTFFLLSGLSIALLYSEIFPLSRLQRFNCLNSLWALLKT
jgi:hypothetical protein